jgi:predicted P-loop ATPase
LSGYGENVTAEVYAHMSEGWDDDEDIPGPGHNSGGDPVADEIADILGDDPEEDTRSIDGDSWAPDDGESGADKPAKKKKHDMTWAKDFRRKANGALEPVLNNIALICQHDPRLIDVIGYNEFTHDPVAYKQIRDKKIHLPSNPVVGRDKKYGRRWEDADDTSIKLIASANEGRRGWETDFSAQSIQEAVLAAGTKNPTHPVKNDIEECFARWKADGAPTGLLDRVPHEFLGCPDTIFHRESSAMFFIGAVARIYEPGCKFDQMVILEGETGGGKSRMWRVLAGGFFSEFRVDLDRLDRTVEAMRGNWFLEMAEMAKAKKTDSNTLKDFLSAASDTIRLAYAKREFTFDRQSVMVATSNEDDYLTDPTSVRRYWVWKTDTTEFNQIDIERLNRVRHHIIGEAYQRYLDMREAQPDGELHLALRTRDAIKEAREIAQGSRRQTVTETIAEIIQEWLDTPHPANEVIVDTSGFADGNVSDELVVRNMVTARECFEALRETPMLAPYRNADARTFGKALKMIDGWTELGQCRRHGQKNVWFSRERDGSLWVRARDVFPDEHADSDYILG